MSTESIREALTTGIQWTAVSTHTTQRGRVKPIVCGIPSQLFWRHYKHGLRSQMTALGLSLKRLAKGQWEVICWPRKETIPILEEMGFKIPETVAADNQPF